MIEINLFTEDKFTGIDYDPVYLFFCIDSCVFHKYKTSMIVCSFVFIFLETRLIKYKKSNYFC